jgi:predicted AlkP superfamily phosphohydrolase/phosphomutase
MNALSEKKIVVIGLDGGEWNVIRPLIEKGLLPNLQKLISEGASGDLVSSIPPITPTAWSSFLTGVNPGKHSIFSYQKKHYGENSYFVKPFSCLDIKKEKLWHILSRHDKKVCFVNVPMSFPPQSVNGYMITGLMTPSNASNYTYPDSLRDELRQNEINYRIDIKINKEINQIENLSFREYYFLRDNATSFFDDIYDLTENRYKAVKYLMTHKPWDFFMTVFIGMDRIQHFLWEFIEKGPESEHEIAKKIRKYYSYLDELIGNIVSMAGEKATIVIMSDHGFGKYKGDFLVNKWLIDLGFFKAEEKKYKTLSGLKRILGKIGINRAAMTKVLGEKKTQSIRMNIQHVDWKNTKAFCVQAHGIHINLKGRETFGCVDRNVEYDEIRETLTKKLYALKDPVTGNPVIKKVYKKEEIYHGEEFEVAPDLVLLSSDSDHYGIYSTRYFSDSIFLENSWKTGDHRQNGIFIMKGPDIKNNYRVGDAKIIDLLPTILHIQGLPVPEYADGVVLKDIFINPIKDVDFENEKKSAGQKNTYDYKEDEVETVKDLLKQLGYID